MMMMIRRSEGSKQRETRRQAIATKENDTHQLTIVFIEKAHTHNKIVKSGISEYIFNKTKSLHEQM
jgi:hypothetical protein